MITKIAFFLVIMLFGYGEHRGAEAESMCPLPTFTVVGELKTLSKPDRIAVGDFDGDHLLDLAVGSAKERAVEIFFCLGAGEYSKSVQLTVGDDVRNIAIGDLNGDHCDDMILVSPSQRRLTVLVSTPGGSGQFQIAQKISFDYSPDGVTLSDLDHDGKLDLIIYGRKFLGVSIAWGIGDGTFQRGPTVASNVTCATAAPAVLSADGFTYLAVLDWIGSNLLIYKEIGRGFRQWEVFSLSEEPTDLLCTDINGDGITDFIISFRESQQIELYLSDGLGNVRMQSSITLHSGVPVRLYFASKLCGVKAGIVSVTTQPPAAGVISINDGNRLGTQALLQPVQSLSDLVVAELFGDTLSSIACLSREERKIVLLRNNFKSAVTLPALVIAGGPQTRSVLAVDVLGDAFLELAALSRAAHAIYLFHSKDGESFQQMWSVGVPEDPVQIRWLSRPTGGGVFLTTHPERGFIAATFVDRHGERLRSLRIARGGNSEILDAEWNTMGGLRFYVANVSPSREITSVSCFDEIAPTKFVEEDFSPDSSEVILSACIADVRHKAGKDVILLLHTKGRNVLSIATKEEKGNFVSTPLWKFPSPPAKRGSVVAIKQNSSRGVDTLEGPLVLVNLVSPAEVLWAFRGHSDSILVPVPMTTSGINMVDPASTALTDWNKDGVVDLIFLNDRPQRDIMVARGMGNGSFHQPQKIESGRDAAGIALWKGKGEAQFIVVSRNSTNVLEFISQTSEN
ncbi:MAG: FG-GAP repeat domain-containing protein [Bacteroidota bacterium]